MTDFNAPRVRQANAQPVNEAGRYVLYWAQMYRRLRANHALDHAVGWARTLKKPIVVYEALKLNYPWANARHHQFVLEGMRDNTRDAKAFGLLYWPFVETPGDLQRGLVRRLLAEACLLVTDDYPQFIVPAHVRAVAAKSSHRVEAVDGNGMVPLARLGPPTAAAAHLRPKIHKLFPEAWARRAAAEPDLSGLPKTKPVPPFELWKPPKDIGAFVRDLPVDQSVPAAPGTEGGPAAGRKLLADFVANKLPKYATERNQPDDPVRNAASGLSWYLHYGHVSTQEVCEAALGTVPKWTPKEINPKARGKDDFFCRDENVNGFLDEAAVWRDVGYQWHYARNVSLGPGEPGKSWQADGEAMPSFNFAAFDFSPLPPGGTLERVLPAWAMASLRKHAGDPRPHTYSVEQFEHADTHDDLWNAAHTELVATGRIHNYMRMLWGKKVLEWSRTPEEGYRTLEYLNNKYANDGRDPNSYSGMLWVFGLFDRPWPPERTVFGNVRYMTSGSTAKKFKMEGYLDYVRRLPKPARVG